MRLEFKKGSELRGRYVISDLLGHGAFAVVWRATDKEAGRDVAIKRMLQTDGQELERLLDEGKKTSRLKGHKNIVEVYDVFEESGEGFLVMEHVEGATLDDIFRQHIRAGTWLDPEEALDYFRQILQGLLFAHASGLYHRDVKPSNILVSKLGVIKLVDFGLAKPIVPSPSEPRHGHTGVAWTGTPNFMSPEQARGEHLDHLTDVFSTGVVGYILLTGRHPFNHPSGIASEFELIQEASFECEKVSPDVIKVLSDSACDVLLRMLHKDKSQRCQSLIEPLNAITKEQAQPCPHCGAPNPVSNVFCGQCGGKLKLPTDARVTSVGRRSGLHKLTARQLTDEGFRQSRDGNWAAAITNYREAIKAEGSYARAYSNLGYALNKGGEYEEAIDVLSKGIDCARDSALRHRLYDARGFSKSNLKDYQGAIEDFSVALTHNPKNPRVFYHQAESRALVLRPPEDLVKTIFMSNCFGAYSLYGPSTSADRCQAKRPEGTRQTPERRRAASSGRPACAGAAATG